MQRANRRSSGRKGSNAGYSRSVDCWNCGLPHHKSKDCTARKVLRCSYCRKQGVRSDQCKCRSNREYDRNRDQGKNGQHKRREEGDIYEACLMVSICGKKVRAIVHSGEQESRLGRKVLSWVESNTKVRPKKKVVKTISGLELARTVSVNIGVNKHDKADIDCIIDDRLPVNEISLGMKALVKLGYRITVAGKETTQRKLIRKPSKADVSERELRKRKLRRQSSDSESSLSQSEDERERRRDWKY